MLPRTVIRNCSRIPRAVIPSIRTYTVNRPTETPTPEEIRVAAASGVRLTKEQVAEISRREQAADPSGQRVHGDPASTAQSIYAKQQQLDKKLDELSQTPPTDVTEKGVGELQSAMIEGRGGKPVEKDNIVSDLHRLAQANESGEFEAVPVSGVSKEEAAEMQSSEAVLSGTGRNVKDGPAAQAQNLADKEEQAEEISAADTMKEQAAALQSEEAQMTGTGRTVKAGVAAQAQSVADRLPR